MNKQFLAVEGDINGTDRRREWRTRRDRATTELLRRDEEVFLHQSLSTPCLDVVDRCSGSTITTRSGNELLDFHGNSVHQGGYGNPFVLTRMQEVLQTLPFSPRRFTNHYAVECAEKLIAQAPAELSRILFAPSGSIANGIALKLARLHTGKHKVVSFWDSFHGAGLDTISVGGEAQFKHRMGPMLSGVFHLPWPGKNGPFGEGADEMVYAEYLDFIARKEGDIGAFIAEPFRCTDIHIPSKSFWKRIREICDTHGILLIFDEIPTALYRAGTFFAFEQFGVVPDMVTLGKGLGGGVVPFAALLAREELNGGGDIALGHYTHEKSPLGAAACLGLLEWFQTVSITDRVRAINRCFLKELTLIESDSIVDIRSIGAAFGVELTSAELAEEVLYFCLEKGLSFKISGGTTLTLTPPLTITDNELHRAAAIIAEAMAVAEGINKE